MNDSGALLVIFGPPAVGKMTIAQEIAARSSFRVFHNHAMLEPLLEVFDYGTPPRSTACSAGSAETCWRRRPRPGRR